MNSHQIVDLVVLGVLLYCAVKGASRGLISQLAWVIALVLCFKFSGSLAPAIEPMIAVDPPLRHWIAMLVVYVGLCGVSFVAAGMMNSWMEKARIIDFDRHLGGLVGLLKGVVICMTGIFFAITMSEPMRQIVSKTYSGYLAATILNHSHYLIPLLPEHTVPTVRHVIDEFNRRLQPGVDDLKGATPAGPDVLGGGSVAGGDSSAPDWLDWASGTRSSGDGNRSSGSDSGAGPRTFHDLMTLIPQDYRDALSQRAIDTIQQSSAEDQRQLTDQLRRALPDDVGSILRNFLLRSSQPPSSAAPPASAAPPSSIGTRSAIPGTGTIEPDSMTQSLLTDIAAIYPYRNDIVDNTRRYLAGVPVPIQRRVLLDWHSDAMGFGADPDPGTTIDTPLDVRIVRQLTRAGISLDQLDRDLRHRLSEVVGNAGRN